MDNKQIEELIDKALREEQALPEGLSERLEQYIHTLPGTIRKIPPSSSSHHRRLSYGLGGIAASILLCIGLFQYTNTRQKDTYSNPAEAALVAQQALAFMSANLNKGFDQVKEARQNMTKANEILNKHLKD